jgi:hypothetical protein
MLFHVTNTHTPLLFSLPAVLCVNVCWQHDETSCISCGRIIYLCHCAVWNTQTLNVSLSLLWEQPCIRTSQFKEMSRKNTNLNSKMLKNRRWPFLLKWMAILVANKFVTIHFFFIWNDVRWLSYFCSPRCLLSAAEWTREVRNKCYKRRWKREATGCEWGYISLKSCQASFARPSDKGGMEVKTSERLIVTAWDRRSAIVILWLNVELHNLATSIVSRFDSDEFKREGCMRSTQIAIWKLGIVTAFPWRLRETKKPCIEMIRSLR